ncbi:MAG: TlpA family protein disulfide reductase [Myxococcaceae bacterium]|nr:TlpA family protein disulfide reductase [Myxococcaceae bacterium]
MKRWGLTVGFVVLCLALLAVLAKGFGKDPHEVPFGMRGKPAPPFQLRDLTTGAPVSLEQFRGKPVVLNFWATWCGPCKQEHPVLTWAQREYGDQVVFLGLIFEDTPENARRYLAENGTPFPQLLDPNSLTAVAYGVAGVPETYFISKDGTILDKHVGPIWPDRMTAYVKALLGKGPLPTATAEAAP